MFLQGSAGTGKTFTVKTLIATLQSCGKKCLICGTTGIAAVQYPGGITLHSLFRLGIDEQFTGSFRSNIGRRTAHARHILAADLIVIDEVSMLTPWVANRVSMTLQPISDHDRIEFGGKRILFAGDLLQLPHVVPNFSMPILYRLIHASLIGLQFKSFS
jgi:ATP-dependent exoDNAse (exonuclease V) alpha subunit